MIGLLKGFIAPALLALSASSYAHAANDTEKIKETIAQGHDQMVAGAELMYQAQKARGAIAESLKSEAGNRFESGIGIYRKAMDQLKHTKMRDAAKLEYLWPMYYNMAAARSLQDRKEEALEHVYQMMSAGFDLWFQLNKERDFDNIRSEPGFKKIVRLAKDAKLVRDVFFEELKKKEVLFPFDFAVTTLENEPLSLAALKGKVVIVNFWGTWYEPWETELRNLDVLRKGFDGRVAVVGLAWERGLAPAEARSHLRKAVKALGIEYPVAPIDKALTGKVPDFATYPTTLFIDKAGRVRFKSSGVLDHASHWMLARLLDLEEPE